MKLEVGKKYRRRDGTGPVEIVGNSASKIWINEGNDGDWYDEKGFSWGEDNPLGLDLVAEWDEPTPLQAGEKYRVLRVEAVKYGGFEVLVGGEALAAFTTIQEATAFIAAHLSAEGK